MDGPQQQPRTSSDGEGLPPPPTPPAGDAPPLLRELWATGAWRLFPLLLVYMSGVTLLIPHIPGIVTDYFAGRRTGHTDLHCEGLPSDAPAADAAACRDAHSDVVMWSSWTSFFSNSFVSIVLTPLLGHWSDLHGRKPFFLVAQACACLPLGIVLAHLTLGVPLLWYYLVQIFISAVSSITPALAFCADLLCQRNRAATFGLIMATFSVAIFVGPAAGAAMEPLTAALSALAVVAACSVYTLLVLPESLTLKARAVAHRSHHAAAREHGGGAGAGGLRTVLGTTLRAARILLRSPLFKRLTLCMMITGVVLEGLQDLLVQYLQLKMDFGVKDVSHIFMIFGGCGLVVQTVLLRTLLGWLGEQRVLMIALVASAAQQAILGVAGVKWVAFLGIGLGSLGSMSFPTISSIKSNNAQEHEQGSVQGALYGARALASGTGPLLFAALFAAFTRTDSPLPYFPGAPFLFGTALMLVALGVAATIPSTAGGSGGSIERQTAQQQQQQAPQPAGEDASGSGNGSSGGTKSGDVEGGDAGQELASILASMLSGIKLVDRGQAEALAREEDKARRRAAKKEKKDRRKKDKKQKQGKKRHDGSDSDGGGGGGSSSDGGGAVGGRLRRQQWSDPDNSSGSDSDGGGGAGGGCGAAGGLQREDWMSKPKARAKTDAQLAEEEEARQEAEASQRRDPDKPFVSDRELNPYFRDGGSGVPPTEGGAAAAPAAARPAAVGDGGASWRLKALKRAQAQAGEEGKKVNEIVSERWGSLAELTAGLTSGRRAAHGNAHLHAARDRRTGDPEYEKRQAERRRMREGGEGGEGAGEERGGGRGEKAAYLSESRSGRSQMQRPKEADSLSWRRRDDRKDGRQEGGERRDGERSRQGSEERSRQGSEEHSRQGGEERSRQGGEERSRQGGEERPRDGGERHEGDRRREDDRGRQQGSRRERPSWRERPPRDPLGRGQDAEALKAAAAELNQFQADGSFMEQFEQQQAAAAAAEGREGDEARPVPGAEVQPSGSDSEHEHERQGQRRPDQHESVAAAMAAERASLARGALAPAAPAAAEAEPEQRPPRPAPAKADNLSAAAMLRARLTGKQPPPEAAPAAEPEPQRAAPARPAPRAPGRPAAAAAVAADEDRGAGSGSPPRRPERETIVLPQIDARGRAVPGAFGREQAGANLPDGGRRAKRVQRYEGGERSKYFADDDETDLQTLMKRTKYGDEGDMDKKLAAGIMKSQRYKQTDHDADAEYDHDAGLEMLDRKSGKRGTRENAGEKEKLRQVREYNRFNSALEQCQLCFASKHRPRHLAVAIGQSTYLAVPQRGRLVPGHCVIVPAEHVASTRQVDEQIWTEIRNFKKCLIQMFMKQGQDVIFFETAMQLGNMRSHASVECVPVPPKAASKAPMYFKKAVDDATSEWATHHAKRFIDTKAKGLRGSIPPNFPYMHVEFGISDGFVHPIDDETKFDRSLARSVLIGLLGLPQEDMHRRARGEKPEVQAAQAEDLRKSFEPYDWTRMLE
ncbi:CWF19 2 [Micractinium conductrix]|uniref:CWF19 2 n=1 Tax=Micractinium conductrix TaxID=554055 RepID=A0A2P6V763_9CHLO|nr:CWF19 2 [Micractinium conductrix]|eukprot:PSC69918.1 CWF19 2 [Micractinium conductrix]